MKKRLVSVLASTLLVVCGGVAAQAMDPNMPGMSGMNKAPSADAQGVGMIKAIDPAKGTITLQHQAIASIHWPAMTMVFKVASPDLLKNVTVGEKVQFGLHPAGMDSTVTSIKAVP
ncbi:copper-binding protein [Rhodanobacter sp. BL-MT-08]